MNYSRAVVTFTKLVIVSALITGPKVSASAAGPPTSFVDATGKVVGGYLGESSAGILINSRWIFFPVGTRGLQVERFDPLFTGGGVNISLLYEVRGCPTSATAYLNAEATPARGLLLNSAYPGGGYASSAQHCFIRARPS